MADSIFRQEALSRMANPERLDAQVQLVDRVDWLALGAFLALAAAALLWAALTFAPVRIEGEGILIDRAGLSEVVTADAGRIASFAVAPGNIVARGQAIATLSGAELDRDLADTRARLTQAHARLARLASFHADQQQKERAANAERLAGISRTRDELRKQLVYLDERAQRVAELVPRGVVRRDAQIDAEAAAASARERITSLDSQADQIRLAALSREGESRLSLLDARNAVEDLEREQTRLQARRSERTIVRAPLAGRVVEVKAAAGDVIAAGAPLATIAQVGRNGDLVAVIYVPAGEGKRTQQGMPVEVAPATVEPAVYGRIRGRVLSVSPLPATREGIRRTLRNDQLVEQLSAGRAVVEVRVALDGDAATPTGFAWTSSDGPDKGVGAGTLARARIVIDRVRVLSFLRPNSA